MLGEEAFAGDPALIDRYAAADHAFTVDPVDGTKNFVHGSQDHAVMVAETAAAARPCAAGSGSRSTSSATSPSAAPARGATTASGSRRLTVPERPRGPCAAAPPAAAWIGQSLDGLRADA